MRGFLSVLTAVLFVQFSPALAGVTGTVHVIDGDTIDVSGIRVRLFGIDAPEQAQTCSTEQHVVWNCGGWVTEQVRRDYEGKWAHCDPVETDRYGRKVSRCWIGGQDVARQLVVEGLALAYRKYALEYAPVEERARQNKNGLHAVAMQTPALFRQTRASGRFPLDRACVIKGNISRGGERIYHMPGQRDYERTGIRLQKGERWFCSPEQAKASGWRPAQR